MNSVRRDREHVARSASQLTLSRLPLVQNYDSDDEDLAVFDSSNRTPTSAASPYSSSSGARPAQHFASNPDPFANSRGAYDPYASGQSQNPASYGGGQAANRFGTAVDVSTQSMSRGQTGGYNDAYDPYL